MQNVNHDNNERVHNERVQKYVKDLQNKYKINDATFVFSILLSLKNNISEDVLDKICKSTKDVSVINARIIAIILGVNDYQEISNFTDIHNNISGTAIKEYSSEIIKSNDAKFQSLSDELIKIKDGLEELNSSDPSSFDVNEEIKQFADMLKETLENNVSEILSLKNTSSENFDENNRKVSQCIDALLELTECNLMLLSEISSIRKKIDEVLSFDLEKNFETFGKKIQRENQKFLAVLEDFMTEQITSINGDITEKNSEKKGYFSFLGNKQKNSEKDKKKTVLADFEKTDKLEKYEQVLKEIEKKSESKIADIFKLIETGVFSDEQVQVIEEGMKARLVTFQLLQIAKPELEPKTMRQLLEYLKTT